MPDVNDAAHGELSVVINNAMKWILTKFTALLDERFEAVEKRLAKIEKQTKTEAK